MPELFYLRKNLLTHEECSLLADHIESSSGEDYRAHYRHTGMLFQDVITSNIPNVMIPIQRALRVANKTFINNYEFTYNHFEIKRLFGNVMYEGAENEPHDDDGDVYPGKTHIEEHYSAILMLNSEYTGGELFFEHKGVEVRLEAGDLIMFRGNAENLHGVRKVLSGKRINVIIFFRNFDLEQPYDSDIWKDFIES